MQSFKNLTALGLENKLEASKQKQTMSKNCEIQRGKSLLECLGRISKIFTFWYMFVENIKAYIFLFFKFTSINTIWH